MLAFFCSMRSLCLAWRCEVWGGAGSRHEGAKNNNNNKVRQTFPAQHSNTHAERAHQLHLLAELLGLAVLPHALALLFALFLLEQRLADTLHVCVALQHLGKVVVWAAPLDAGLLQLVMCKVRANETEL